MPTIGEVEYQRTTGDQRETHAGRWRHRAMTRITVSAPVRRAITTQVDFRDAVVLPTVPLLPEPNSQNAFVAFVMPVLGSLGGLIFIFVHPTKVFIVAGVAMAALSISLGLANAISNRRAPARRLRLSRERFLAQLAELRAQRHALWLARRDAADDQLGTSATLLARAFDDAKRWDRCVDDPDFGWVRCGNQPASRLVSDPAPSGVGESTILADRESARALAELVGTMSDVQMPAVLDLKSRTQVVFCGPDAAVRANALIANLTVSHGPQDLSISIESTARTLFAWTRWLPHLHVGSSAGCALHLRVIVAETLPQVASPRAGCVDIVVCPRRDVSTSSPELVRLAVIDCLGARQAESIARVMAPYVRVDSGVSHDVAKMLQQWTAAPSGVASGAVGRLQAVLGTSPTGAPVILNLNEAALGGVGPHGLCIGATGSGKSELLRTMVTSLALTHTPDELSLLLVDFKGGAAFADLANLAHVSGVVTNLADDAPLIERVRASLLGELEHRQEALAQAGHLPNVAAYNAAVRQGRLTGRTPLPSLLVIIDEFGELLAAQPDFAEVFSTIGRIGRSLGVHLLLASQRLEEGRLRGLESHLSYRICLRTFSAGESRAVIGSPIAADLPNVPGHGYLAASGGVPTRLVAAYVSGPTPMQHCAEPQAVSLFDPWRTDEGRSGDDQAPSLVDLMLTAQRDQFAQTRQIWAPVLPTQLPLTELWVAASDDPLHPRGRLVAPIALGDLPSQQCRIVVDLDLCFTNALIVGGPRSGVSSAIETAVLSLASLSPPGDLAIHVIDMAGSLLGLASLAHVGTVAGRRDPESVGRVLAWCGALVERREGLFAAAAISHVDAWRSQRDNGKFTDEPATDVVLVLDGWQQFRHEWPDAEGLVTALAQRGPAVGMHLLIGTGRWADVRSQLRDACATRIELRLSEPSESVHPRRVTNLVGPLPGRGVSDTAVLIQVADPNPLVATLELVAARWPDSRSVEPVPVLPRLVPRDRLADSQPSSKLGEFDVQFGIRECDLAAAGFRLDRGNPHLLIFGEAGTGVTSTLRTIAHRLSAPNPDAIFALVDYRRGLLSSVPAEQVAMVATNESATLTLVSDVCEEAQRRLPPANVTPQQLVERSWWAGPELFVIIDDEDLVAGNATSPLARLAEVAVHGGDVGVHIILGRRVSGMSRAIYTPLLTRLRDLGTQAFVMSGDPAEGVIAHGERATSLPVGRGRLLRRRQPGEVIQVAQGD